MTGSKLRRKIAWEAARLIYQQSESQYFRAKMRAARQIHPGTISAEDLPENHEIRAQIRVFARQDQQQVAAETAIAQRTHAYHLMQQLRPFQPRLTGAVLSGDGPPEYLEIHAFADDVGEFWQFLDALDYDSAEIEAPPNSDAKSPPTAQILVNGAFPVILSLFPRRLATGPGHREAAGRRVPQATLGQLRQLLQHEAPESLVPLPLDPAPFLSPDRFGHYQSLLAPLETIQQSRQAHPEGDAMYHSLQVFELAREESPYDEEFLLAALLHDVGKGIDQRDPQAATLESLTGWVSERTLWFIAHLPEAHAIIEQKIGMRAHRRLQAHDDFDELMTLARCDLAGRRRGIRVPDVPDVLDYLRNLERMCEE